MKTDKADVLKKQRNFWQKTLVDHKRERLHAQSKQIEMKKMPCQKTTLFTSIQSYLELFLLRTSFISGSYPWIITGYGW